ncbi:hypothetical protein [Rhodococcus sp. ACT016]
MGTPNTDDEQSLVVEGLDAVTCVAEGATACLDHPEVVAAYSG